MTKVSVIIPAYNTAATLTRALDSVLAQTEQDFEIVLIDDGSRDSTLDVARSLAAAEPRIRLIALPENGGKSRALNLGIAEARGTWIATLDADDRYQPERLQTLIAAAEREALPMAADNQNHWDDSAGVIVRTAFPAGAGSHIVGLADFIAHNDTGAAFSFGILKPIIRADFIRANQLGYRPGLKLGEDFYHLMQFFAAGGRGILIDRPLYDWTLPFGPVSRQWTTTGLGAWRYDYTTTIEANAHFLQLMEAQGQNELAALLRRREREYRVMLHYIEAQKTLAQTGNRLAAARIIARHPNTWPLLARRVTGRLRRAAGV